MNTISTEGLPVPATEPGSARAASKKKDESFSHPGAEAQRSPSSAVETKELLAKIQNHLNGMNISVTFSTYGEKDDRTAVVVKERETGKLIREIPPEELQTLHEKMQELLGLIFSDRA
jgi:uncharacterized FlaG/YvyC family protein